MRIVLVVSLLLVFGVACIGCGVAGQERPRAATSPSTATTGVVVSGTGAIKSFPQDEDDDDSPGEAIGHDPHDSDVDGDNDRAKPLGYYDRDDAGTRSYGHAANAKDKRELTALTKRYYGAAALSDGATACSLLAPAIAKTVVSTYGRGSAGPRYLSTADTCGGVLTLLFKHVRQQVSTRIQIVRVRVTGKTALVLIGGNSTLAGFFEALREGSQWRFMGMLPSMLP